MGCYNTAGGCECLFAVDFQPFLPGFPQLTWSHRFEPLPFHFTLCLHLSLTFPGACRLNRSIQPRAVLLSSGKVYGDGVIRQRAAHHGLEDAGRFYSPKYLRRTAFQRFGAAVGPSRSDQVPRTCHSVFVGIALIFSFFAESTLTTAVNSTVRCHPSRCTAKRVWML